MAMDASTRLSRRDRPHYRYCWLLILCGFPGITAREDGLDSGWGLSDFVRGRSGVGRLGCRAFRSLSSRGGSDLI